MEQREDRQEDWGPFMQGGQGRWKCAGHKIVWNACQAKGQRVPGSVTLEQSWSKHGVRGEGAGLVGTLAQTPMAGPWRVLSKRKFNLN